MILVIKSSSSGSVFFLMMFIMISISSSMLFFLFSQYSRSIEVKRSPKFNWASSHLWCRVELTIGTCGVRLVLRDFGMDLVCSHLFK